MRSSCILTVLVKLPSQVGSRRVVLGTQCLALSAIARRISAKIEALGLVAQLDPAPGFETFGGSGLMMRAPFWLVMWESLMMNVFL